VIILDCYGRTCNVLQKLALSSERPKLFACIQISFSEKGHIVGTLRSKLIRQYFEYSKIVVKVLYLVAVLY
jgi:hypothetical protein